jgi:type II secretory pathway predicted ATPase ExeA
VAVNWTDHFGLTAAPFSKAIADADLWLTPHKRRAVSELAEAIEERNTGALLVGDSGQGKSCVLRALRHRLADSNVRLTYCHNTTLGRRDFYRQICHALSLSPRATAAGVFDAVSSYVQELACEQLHPVFLIDEAHLLHQDVLDHLHILANYEWDSRPLLTLVFAGLPELWDRMLLRRNRSLWSRIHTRLRLPEPEPSDTVEYVEHRLRLAGCDREVFTSDALAMLHEGSSGRLRDVDRIATAAMKEAARGKHSRVDRAILVNVVASHQR